MAEQTRPLHPPPTIQLQVEGSFPGFPPDKIKVEAEKGTFSLYRGEKWLADGQLAVDPLVRSLR